MSCLLEVRGRVAVHGVVATSDLPAREAHTEVHPVAADPQALLAAEWAGREIGDLDCGEVAADIVRHGTAILPALPALRVLSGS